MGSRNFDEMLINLIKDSEGEREVKVSPKDKFFSPSSLLTFADCQKSYEYKYIYNMPDRKVASWEAMMLGSFVHSILDEGVKKGFGSLRKFLNLAQEILDRGEYGGIEFSEVEGLIRVFYERNKEKYNRDSKTEQRLILELAGINFIGFADRIDFNSDGLEIIDYKTGKGYVPPRARNWQLGYYALAASKLGKVRKITLDMLKQEKPLEFELDDQGNAKAVNSDRMGFNIYQVEEELIKTAHAVISAYENGFKPCGVEKNCEFCNEFVYGL